MKRRFFLGMIPLLGIWTGKSADPKKENFAEFFLTEVKSRMGKDLSLSPLPKFQANWRIERDDYGFQIWIKGVDFRTVDHFLTQVLGAPQRPAEKNLKGELQSGYYRNASGMHIQLQDQASEVYLVAVGKKKKADQ